MTSIKNRKFLSNKCNTVIINPSDIGIRPIEPITALLQNSDFITKKQEKTKAVIIFSNNLAVFR